MIGMNRREWSKTMMGGALMAASESRKQTYAIVGAGVFGSWTAHQLVSAGHKVVLIDQYGPSSGRASSGGETRIIRASYGPDEIYTRFAQRSLGTWKEFFESARLPFFRHAGVLWFANRGNTYVAESRETLTKAGVPFENLSTADLRSRYPQIQVPDGTTAILEPLSGALMAREAVRAVANRVVQLGGAYHQVSISQPRGNGRLSAVTTNDGERITADAFVFACGPWLPKTFPDLLGSRIFVTRQEVLFFGTPKGDLQFSPPAMPVWIDFNDDRGMYGFPDIDTRGFKVAFDRHGPPFDPDSDDRFVRKEKIDEARRYVAERFPGLASAPIVDARVCQYENTSNGDFLIDKHPDFDNVWLVGGGSGHGFKHGPAVGEYVAARVTGAATPAIEPRFSLASKGTQQNRAVY